MRRLFQVADGIYGGYQPQNGGQADEQHRQRIRMQYQVQTRCEGPARLVAVFMKDAPDHHADEDQLNPGTAKVECSTQPVTALAQEENHQPGQQ